MEENLKGKTKLDNSDGYLDIEGKMNILLKL